MVFVPNAMVSVGPPEPVKSGGSAMFTPAHQADAATMHNSNARPPRVLRAAPPVTLSTILLVNVFIVCTSTVCSVVLGRGAIAAADGDRFPFAGYLGEILRPIRSRLCGIFLEGV